MYGRRNAELEEADILIAHKATRNWRIHGNLAISRLPDIVTF
jgi:hypothetical protein